MQPSNRVTLSELNIRKVDFSWQIALSFLSRTAARRRWVIRKHKSPDPNTELAQATRHFATILASEPKLPGCNSHLLLFHDYCPSLEMPILWHFLTWNCTHPCPTWGRVEEVSDANPRYFSSTVEHSTQPALPQVLPALQHSPRAWLEDPSGV